MRIPGTASASGGAGGVICQVIRDRHGFVYIYLAYTSRIPREVAPNELTEYRPVAFDSRGRRYEFDLREDLSDLDRGNWDPDRSVGRQYSFEVIARRPDELSLNRGQFRIVDDDCDLAFVRFVDGSTLAFDVDGKRRRLRSRSVGIPDPSLDFIFDTFAYCYDVQWGMPVKDGKPQRPAPRRPTGPDRLAFVGVERMRPEAFKKARQEHNTKLVNYRRAWKAHYDQTHPSRVPTSTDARRSVPPSAPVAPSPG